MDLKCCDVWIFRKVRRQGAEPSKEPSVAEGSALPPGPLVEADKEVVCVVTNGGLDAILSE